jgi:hypothetical protein
MRDLGDLAHDLSDRARLGRCVFRNFGLWRLLAADQNLVRHLPDDSPRRRPTVPTLNFMKENFDGYEERRRSDSRTDR